MEKARKKGRGKLAPHSWLLFSTVLNHSTSPSGHNHRPQNRESNSTVMASNEEEVRV